MTNIRIDKIQIKRGTVANLPILDDGELFYAYDTKEHYLGMGGVNQLLSKDFVSLNQHYESVASRFGINSSGKLTIDGVEQIGGGGSAGSLVFNTLADLQAAYPNGTTQPAWIVADNAWYYWSGAIVSDTTAPVLTITAGGTFTGIKSVTMSANETADIYYTIDGSTPTTSSTKYTSPLSISATTTLKAFAKDIAGNSSAVQTVTYTLDATPPADTTAPVNVTNLAYSNLAQTSLTLTWTASASSDVSSYDVYNGLTLLANVTGTTYNVSSLTASTQYTFTVKAKDAANNIASGVSVTVTTSTPADTTAPNNVASVTPSNITQTGVTLTWPASSSADVTGYDIYNGSTFITTVTGLTYNVTGLTASTSYTFSVRARDAAGNVASGTTANVTTAAPADTTAPLLTMTPAATFTDMQTVTMTANETATIYYTLDDTDPKTSGTKLTYSAPLTLTATDTVKAYAKDAAGNESAVQTVTYTKETVITGPTTISMNGTSDYVQAPTLSFDEIQMEIMSTRSGVSEYYFDGRTGATSWLSKNTNGTESFSGATIYVDGVPAGSGTTSLVTLNKRMSIKAVYASAITDDVTIFAKNTVSEFMKGKLYKIKFLLAGAIVAAYDFTQQFAGTTVPDNSGNGNVATLNGGTWESDTTPPTGTATPYYISLDGVDDLVNIPIPVNTKYIELKVSRENSDTSGYVMDLRTVNAVYSGSVGASGYSAITVDGVSKTVAAANATTDLPNGVASTVKYTLSSLSKSGVFTIGAKSVTPAAADFMTMKLYDVKLYDQSNVVLNSFDFTTGTGTTLYGTSGMNGTIKGGGTWVAI